MPLYHPKTKIAIGRSKKIPHTPPKYKNKIPPAIDFSELLMYNNMLYNLVKVKLNFGGTKNEKVTLFVCCNAYGYGHDGCLRRNR